MSDILTAEERSALQEPYAAGRATRLVTPAVFPSINQLDPERVAALGGQFRHWFERVAKDLSEQVRLTCVARPPVHQIVARNLLPSVEDEPLWAAVEGYSGSDLLVTLPRSFAAAISERIFGAPFELRGDRTLSPAESVLLRDLIQRWLNLAQEIWQTSALNLSPAVEEMQEAEDTGDTAWLRFEADLVCGAVSGAISVTLAPFTARVLLGEAIDPVASSLSTEALVSRLGEVRVEVQAILGQAEFSLDELSSLRVGDVIALDRSAQDPVDIVLQDRKLFRARAGVAGQWVAIELIDGPKEQKRYEH